MTVGLPERDAELRRLRDKERTMLCEDVRELLLTQQYPARLDFEPRRVRGGGDLWVAEAGLRYDGGDPVSVVKILQFRGDRIERETLYFADPFPAPEWRRPFAEPGAEQDRQPDLPAHVAAGRPANLPVGMD